MNRSDDDEDYTLLGMPIDAAKVKAAIAHEPGKSRPHVPEPLTDLILAERSTLAQENKVASNKKNTP